MNPKCFSEEDLPPLIPISRSMGAFRNEAETVTMTKGVLSVQSICLCIAGIFLFAIVISDNAIA